MSERPNIVYSCYGTRNRQGEQFVSEHVFGYQVSGTNIMNDGTNEYIFNPGDFRFIKRNSLLKFTKIPPPGGEFKAISIFLDPDTLQKFSIEHHIQSAGHVTDAPVIWPLKGDLLFKSYIDSLMPYVQNNELNNHQLVKVKVTEAILLLLKSNPELKDVLFDFNEPGKIDLEAFMNKNFHFNVEMKRFALLTGRSLATFKRDFEKVFNESPNRWLQHRRLQEAHYLIKEQGKTPSEIYLELGFENLSHFSFAFKKTYGVAPTKLLN